MAVLDLVAVERIRLADALDELDAHQWAQQSLCGRWTNHHVAAHLVVPFDVSMPKFALAMLKARGNFDVVNDAMAREMADRRTPGDCVDHLREKAMHPFKPPGFGHEAPLNDVITHGGDILEPLGRSVDPDPESLEVVLALMASGKAKRVGAATGGKLTLAPTDLGGATFGSGPELIGPARAIIGAVCGRSIYFDRLEGPGLDVLRAASGAGR